MFSTIVFAPLAGAIIAGFFGRLIGVRGAQAVTCGLMLLSAVLSGMAFVQVALGGQPQHVMVMTWIASGDFKLDWAFKIDTLTAVMLVVVTWVSTIVHIYSVGYMSHDKHPQRFMAYLSLFTFAMLMLVTADNLVQMFFGWEGVGLASYLLIGFWYERPSANAAAIKAFVVNRVGDFGFALGIFAIYLLFGTVSFDEIFAAAPAMAGKTLHFLSWQFDAMTIICLLLFIGAMGKSAQLFLHTWLPDAMEGPTPVSALIHAATMVTAGVFMVCRCSPLFEMSPVALNVVTIVGASTAFFAATVGLVQNDIKRVIAYSTCSQLGYMFFAAGVSAYEAAMFHLFTHAFFKALLFLGAGSVIHALHDEQDMRKMGGIYKLIPGTYVLMLIGTVALMGFPYTAGYFSKDAILESAFANGTGPGMYAYSLGIMAAFMTSFYSWRLIFMTFHGKSRADEHTLKHAHESPPVMLVPLLVLAAGALGAGLAFNGLFVGHGEAAFWGKAIFTREGVDVLEARHHIPALAIWAPTIVGLLGFLLAYQFYIRDPEAPKRLAETHYPLYQFLLNKWYFDELYDAIFVKPSLAIGRLFWKKGDGAIIDDLGPNNLAARAQDMAGALMRFQSGYLYHYAFVMLVGVAGLVTYFMLSAR